MQALVFQILCLDKVDEDLKKLIEFCRTSVCGDNPSVSPESAPDARRPVALAAQPADPVYDQIHQLALQLGDLIYPHAVAGKEIPPEVLAQAKELVARADSLAGGDAAQFLADRLAAQEQKLFEAPLVFGADFGNEPERPILYAAVVVRPKEILLLRGKTGPFGDYSLFVPRDGTLLSVSFYDPIEQTFASVSPTVSPNAPYLVPRPVLRPVSAADQDGDRDGLADVVELVYGTDLAKADSDGDGISDGAEAKQGTNPLDGLPAATGIVGSADTPGTAVDVCAVNDLAIVADSHAGIAVFNVFSGMPPTVIAQVDTSGIAQRVSCSGSLVAVADGSAGLAIVDITDPPAARIVRQLALGGEAISVAAAGNMAFVGLRSGEIVTVELSSGAIRNRRALNGPVQDIVFGGDFIYALTETTLHVLSSIGGELIALNSVASPFVAGPNQCLFVGGGIAYAVHGKGYNTFSLANPERPTLITASNTAQFGWKQIVLNGSGLGLAAVSPNQAFDGPHNVSLYDVSDPAKTDQFITTFETPGIARAVSIYNGLAYVADHDRGLHVINYLPYDAKNTPPTISLNTSFNADRAEEGQLGRVTANVADDVQVRNVEFYIDGVKATTDGNFPFEYRFVTPTIAPQKNQFTLQAVATDTGGNRSSSPLLTVNLVKDATPPRVVRFIPAPGGSAGDALSVVVYLSEPINRDTLSAANFQVVSSGPDGKFGTADDVVVPNGIISFDESVNALSLTFPTRFAPGAYQIVLRNVTDSIGNILPETLSPFSSGAGLTGEYYDELNFRALKLTRVDPTIDFDWGTGSPDPAIVAEQFSVRWRGSVIPKFSEDYVFYTLSDDGVRLWVNGELLIENWTDHGPTENKSRTIRLNAGERYEIQLDFYENTITAVAKLLWSSPSQPKEIIPASQLLPYEDHKAPYILRVIPDLSLRSVTIQFSEVMDSLTANDAAKYSLSGGIGVRAAELQPNGTDVRLTTDPHAEATDFTLAVEGVRDASAQGNLIAAGTQKQFRTYATIAGALRREAFLGIGSGGLVSDLTSSPNFPHGPDLVEFVPAFESSVNLADGYGQRVSGWLIPPATGDYIFYLASDDQGQLFLSTDDNPANKVQIATEPVWNEFRYWVGTARRNPTAPENVSRPIRLQAGQRYYIEALMKEIWGGDHVEVTWQYVRDAASVFVVEAEDFDFDGGQHKPEADAMPYRGGAYAGAGAVKGVDWDGAVGGPLPYRPTVDVGMSESADKSRVTFEVTTNFKVGWNDAGDWYNYTRVFPNDNYNVYARAASGGLPISVRLEEVVSGQKTPNQTLQKLGEFNAPATGSWDIFSAVPLRDANGNLASVALSGERTLRFTVQPGNLDFNHLYFVPAAPNSEAPLFGEPPNGSPPIPGQFLTTYDVGDFTGYVTREVYLNVAAPTLAELEKDPRFGHNPDDLTFPTQFEAPNNVGDNYAQRVHGYLSPPVSGDYVFFIASDDQSALFLSTDDNSANKVQIASEPNWNGVRQWNTSERRTANSPENRSKPIPLIAGKKYYIEAIHREVSGNDNLAVTWQLPGALQPGTGAAPIPGAFLSTVKEPGLRLALAPASQTVAAGAAASFVVIPSGAPPFKYQWLRNDVPIAGANGFRYTIPAAQIADNDAVFAVQVVSSTESIVSPGAKLSVTP